MDLNMDNRGKKILQLPTNQNINRSDFRGEPKVCRRCGRLFDYSGFGHLYCPACKVIDDITFQKVKDYIFDNGIATAVEVSDATGVSLEHIEQYLREGRLEIPENSPIFIKCDKCGTDIRSGKYCPECASRLSVDLKSALDFDKYQVGETPKKKNDGKMRFLTRE